MASSRGHEACVQLLLESAAAANGLLDDQDKWGNTALHLAVRKRHAQVGWLAGVYLSEIAPSIEKANDTRGGEGEIA